MQLKPNTLLQGGKYRIEKVLGRGGFGITYEVTHTIFEKRMAIKEFFYKDYCERDKGSSLVSLGTQNSRELVERFMAKFVKEARMISQFDHPDIIRIHDIFHENNTAYYVMDFIEGESLSDMVKQRGALPEMEAIGYIRQIASALDFIHGRSVNHLDVKPANVMVRQSDGRAILIDFGISKQYDAEGGQTSTTPVGISHGYAPMEQYNAGGVSTFSPQADIYSLGATLYKLVTGITPPQANEVFNDGLPAIPSHLSASTVRAITKAMQPGRKDRPQSVAEFMALLGGEEETDVKPKPNPQPIPTPVPKPSPWKKWAVPLAVGILAALAVIFWPKGGDTGGGGTNSDTLTAIMEITDSAAAVPAPKPNGKKEETPAPQPEKAEPVKEETPAPSLLYVTTSPSGATVYVDGKKVGTTPIEGKEVSQGRHTVKITKSGYESFSEKRQFGDKPVVLNETLVAEAKEAPSVQPTASQQASSRASDTGTINGHTYVNLGLSVKWADRNVGASSPSDYGSYFAWGETSTKSEYTPFNSVTREKNIGDIRGNSRYDAARANWGGSWRLPTKAELEELKSKCTWTWTTQGGHNGYKVVGPNGNSIFLPASESLLDSAGEHGSCWSSTPDEGDTMYAYSFGFNSSSYRVYWSYRNFGLSVRPVSE